MAILAEDLSGSQNVPLSATAQATLRQVIQTVLSSEDWDAISAAAALSLQQHIRAVVTLSQTADAIADVVCWLVTTADDH